MVPESCKYFPKYFAGEVKTSRARGRTAAELLFALSKYKAMTALSFLVTSSTWVFQLGVGAAVTNMLAGLARQIAAMINRPAKTGKKGDASQVSPPRRSGNRDALNQRTSDFFTNIYE